MELGVRRVVATLLRPGAWFGVVWYSLVLPGAHLLADPATPILPRLPRLCHAHPALAVALLPCKGQGHTPSRHRHGSAAADTCLCSPCRTAPGGAAPGAGRPRTGRQPGPAHLSQHPRPERGRPCPRCSCWSSSR